MIDQKKKEVAIKAFVKLCQLWKLDKKQQVHLLDLPTDITLLELEKNPNLMSDVVLERISYLLGIYKQLNTYFTDEKQANSWIHKKNKAELFSGKTALEYMLKENGAHLSSVKQYLENQFS